MERFPYAFSSPTKKAVRDEFDGVLQRIADRLAQLKKLPPAEALHETRTLIKLLRTLLWLAKPSLPPALAKAVKKKLQDIAQKLAGSRDASVVKSTLTDLEPKARKPAQRDGLRFEQEQALKSTTNAQELRMLLQKVVAEILKVIAKIQQKDRSTAKWKSPRGRVKKASQQTNEAYEMARETGTPLCYHGWRKKAKRLLYLLQLLENSPSRREARTIERLDRLQHELGDYHDNSVLEDKLKRSRRAKDHQPVLPLVRKRKRQLRRKAEKTARQLDF